LDLTALKAGKVGKVGFRRRLSSSIMVLKARRAGREDAEPWCLSWIALQIRSDAVDRNRPAGSPPPQSEVECPVIGDLTAGRRAADGASHRLQHGLGPRERRDRP
jgi:hypothetical protein